jgi:hypothetical protein
MIEQRKNQRFDLRLPLEIVNEKSHRPKGETMNVSSCGVLFTTPGAVQIGDPIEYLITLPKVTGSRTDVRLRCIGKVVRSVESTPAEGAVAAFAATLERYEFLRGKG